jgi:hypothetical protein
VAGNIGPIPELFEDGVEGRFWPLDDPAQAAATLIDLLDSEPARLKAASAANERFHREFDTDLIVPRLLSFLLGRFGDHDSTGGQGSQESTTADQGPETGQLNSHSASTKGKQHPSDLSGILIAKLRGTVLPIGTVPGPG